MIFSHINITTIFNQRFNRELYAGTLPKEKFMAFLSLDVMLYLPQYSHALQSISDRFSASSQPVYAEQFAQLAKINNNYIGYIHTKYPMIQEQHTHAHAFYQPAPSPEKKLFKQYADHLCKPSSLPEAIARITACLWLYTELGKLMDLSQCPPEHPYLPWLESYKDPQFVGTTNELVATLTTLLENTNSQYEKDQIMLAFQESLDFDLAIFELIHPQEAVAQCRNLI